MPIPLDGVPSRGFPVDEKLSSALDELTRSRVVVGIIFLLVSSPGVINMFHILLYVFIAPDDPYWCSVPALEDAGWTDEHIRNISSPRDARGSSCKYYENDYEMLAKEDFESALKMANHTVKLKCKKYEFYNKNTLVREWNLVCEYAALKTTVEMALSLGKATGATVFGWVADRWGRKRSLTFSVLIFIASAFTATFSPWLSLFIVMRFFVGFGGVGCYNCGFVLLTEMCHPKDRQLLGILFNLGYGIGMLLLSLIAYYVREWRRLHLYLTIPTLLLLIQIWLLPESPKWLMSQGRNKEAWDVIRRTNMMKRVCCQPQIEIYSENVEEKGKEVDAASPTTSTPREPPPTKTCCARAMGEFYPLLANGELRTRLIIKLFLWTATNLTYYTLSLNCDNFGSDRYVFMAMAGLTEVVGYLIPVPLLNFMGRTLLELVLFSITSVCLLLILVVPYENKIVILVVAMVARLCVTAVFAVIILHTSELFPVEIRNTAFGLISTSSSIGSMAAPLLVSMIGAIDHKLPSTVCGVTMIGAAFLSRVLPETRNTELAYTIEEEMERRKVSFKNCMKF